jgi:hypothetical protein
MIWKYPNKHLIPEGREILIVFLGNYRRLRRAVGYLLEGDDRLSISTESYVFKKSVLCWRELPAIPEKIEKDINNGSIC